ncbi:hypothetical protein ACLKA6_018483 [Drosophila palustris]
MGKQNPNEKCPHSVLYPTGSNFKGNSNSLGMQDFGLYTYPDGTRYLGQFLNNRFHGTGTIELPSPHCVSFSVLHRHGELIEIQSMTFNDNLPVEFDWKGETMTFDNWNYCTAKDRRFCAEKSRPMEAVGPHKFKSREGPNPPPLGRNIFDLGFGKFNRRGCVTGMPTHISKTRQFHVDCPEMREWIQNNCRHGELKNIHLSQETRAQFARQIIENNLENEKSFLEELPSESNLARKSPSCLSAKEMRLGLGETSDSYSSIFL